jgi:hypothetical protein
MNFQVVLPTFSTQSIKNHSTEKEPVTSQFTAEEPTVTRGHAVVYLVEALCYKPEGRGFDSG